MSRHRPPRPSASSLEYPFHFLAASSLEVSAQTIARPMRVNGVSRCRRATGERATKAGPPVLLYVRIGQTNSPRLLMYPTSSRVALVSSPNRP